MSQRSRYKHKGRAANASFVSIPHFVLRSQQWGALDSFAVKLLMDLAGQYNGINNGDLSAPFSVMQHRGWNSETTLTKRLAGLEESGWIIKTKQGGRRLGCNLYAITWWPVNECGGKHQEPVEKKPSHLWKTKTRSVPQQMESMAPPRGVKTTLTPSAGGNRCPDPSRFGDSDDF
ncbi:hypothetical protein G4G30_04700 [Stenotrophomonas maltophilia]|nr:hypothetical protein G4G30_04700 [Stenotrophomonas maltophilia]